MLSSLLLLLLSLSASGSIVILLIYVICLLLHKKLSHQWQYYIWIAAVARLLLPFSPQENLMGHLTGSLRDANSSYENACNEQNEPGNSPNSAYNSMNGQSSSHADTSGSLNEQSNSHYDTSGSVQEQNNSYVKSASKVKDNIVRSIKVFIKRITNKLWEYRMYLCIFWLVTAMLLFLRKITVYQDFMRFIRAGSTPVDDIGCLEALSQIEARLNIQKPIDIWSSRLITSPMLIGFRHPCIVLPEKAHLSRQAFHYTVLHELIHYKRMDLYYKWFVQLALCIHWFNPFVYAMARRINRLCELSCDEAVTARLDGVSQYREYAATLLAAMASGRDYREQIASLTLTENKQLLKERMEFIMRRKEITASKKLLTVILTAAVTVAGIYSGCCPIRASAVQEKAGQTELADTSDHAISDNATGVYAEEDYAISINSAKNKNTKITAGQADEMALALTNKIWVWEWVEFFVPYMSKEGAEKLVSASKHSEWAGSIDYTSGKKLKFTKKQVNAARKHTPSEPLTCKDLDGHALMIMQSNGDWECISFMLPYMSKKGIRAVTRCYNSKHKNDKKRAADYY